MSERAIFLSMMDEAAVGYPIELQKKGYSVQSIPEFDADIFSMHPSYAEAMVAIGRDPEVKVHVTAKALSCGVIVNRILEGSAYQEAVIVCNHTVRAANDANPWPRLGYQEIADANRAAYLAELNAQHEVKA